MFSVNTIGWHLFPQMVVWVYEQQIFIYNSSSIQRESNKQCLSIWCVHSCFWSHIVHDQDIVKPRTYTHITLAAVNVRHCHQQTLWTISEYQPSGFICLRLMATIILKSEGFTWPLRVFMFNNSWWLKSSYPKRLPLKFININVLLSFNS